MLNPTKLLLAALAGVACHKTPPSEEPLGWGPLALRERQSEERASERRASAKAEAELEPQTESIEIVAEPVDAGVSDAGLDAEAGSDDAGTEAGADADTNEAGPTQLAFAGEFIGSDVMVIRLSKMPEQTQKDPKARTRIEQDNPNEITVSIVDSSNGGVLCSFDAKVKDNDATVKPGQACFGSNDGPMQGTITSGKLRLSDDRLVMDIEAEVEAEFGEQSLKGDIEYHFEGRRE